MSDPTIPAAPALSGSEAAFRLDDTGPASAMPPPPWAREGQMVGQGSVTLPDGRRFAALSTLPEGRRIPPRRDVPLAKHLRQELPSAMESPAPEAAETLPSASTPVLLPPAESRQLGFNCPACFAVLIIKDPATYDGRPAPCPTCGIRIQPPQCVPDSPFSIVHRTEPVPPPQRHGLHG